jgi:hypothetical protein
MNWILNWRRPGGRDPTYKATQVTSRKRILVAIKPSAREDTTQQTLLLGFSWIEDGATTGGEPQTLDGGPRTVRENGHATVDTDDYKCLNGGMTITGGEPQTHTGSHTAVRERGHAPMVTTLTFNRSMGFKVLGAATLISLR